MLKCERSQAAQPPVARHCAQESLSGNSQTCVLACLHPTPANVRECGDTLHLALRCTRLHTAPVINTIGADEPRPSSAGGATALAVAALQARVEALEAELDDTHAHYHKLLEARDVAAVVARVAYDRSTPATEPGAPLGDNAAAAPEQPVSAAADTLHSAAALGRASSRRGGADVVAGRVGCVRASRLSATALLLPYPLARSPAAECCA